MNELHIHNSHKLIQLDYQNDFPDVDLSESNAHMLKYLLRAEPGVIAKGIELEQHQRYIHMIADQALKLSGIETRYAEEELRAFSHGFASFETINDLVHPARLYSIAKARQTVAQLFVDTRDGFELEVEELYRADKEGREPLPASRDKPLLAVELSERQAHWQATHPNTWSTVLEVGTYYNEDLLQLQARSAGAHVAYLLQHPPLDVA